MSLQEFDALMEKMRHALEYADNLGQYVDGAKILFQMNEHLPGDLQVNLGELEDSDAARSFVTRYNFEVRSAITEYRQRLMDY